MPDGLNSNMLSPDLCRIDDYCDTRDLRLQQLGPKIGLADFKRCDTFICRAACTASAQAELPRAAGLRPKSEGFLRLR